MLTASLAKAASRPLKVADAARRAFYAASLNVRRGELVARLVAAVVRPCSRAVVRSADGPALAPSRRPARRGRGALNTTRSRPARSAAAGGGLDSPALPGALFLNRCVPSKAGFAPLQAALLSAVELARSAALRAQFKLSVRRVCTSL